jgi:uncharacterized protein DUF1275/enoyl-CoA hydratase/isomerase-like protein
MNMTPVANVSQIRLERRLPSYWRVTFDIPPVNIFGPKNLAPFNEIISKIETDEQVKVVVFDSAIEGFFLTHWDFLAKPEDDPGMPPGSTGLQPFPDMLARLSRAPVVSIVSIRGRAAGCGSELAWRGRQHLRVPIVRRERPAMTKHDRLAAAPIFIVDLYSVFGCDVAHIFSFLLMVHCCLPRFDSDNRVFGLVPTHNEAARGLFIVCMCLALGIQNGALHKTNGISVHSTYVTGMVTTLMQKTFDHYSQRGVPKKTLQKTRLVLT